MLQQIGADGLQRDVGIVLGGNDNRIDADGNAVFVFDRNLCFAVGPQIGQGAVLSHLGQAAGQPMRQRNRQGHQFLGLAAGIPEHHALVTGTGLRLVIGAAGFQGTVNAHRDIGRLLIEADHHVAGLAV